MTHPTRRAFHRDLLASVTAYGFLDLLLSRGLLADEVKPLVHQWARDLQTMCLDLKTQKMKDIDFQAKLEELYRKIDLAELIALLDLDQVARATRLPDNGAASVGIDLSKVEGLPRGLAFGRQIFGMQKGRAIVPHGHDNLATGFIVLRGNFHGRHYERIQDNKDHYLIRPTIDRKFKPGECSTVSDHKDNVHWFVNESETGFIFNIHVSGYNPDNPKIGSRVYIDPQGERNADGLIVARKITSAECHRKYG